MILLWVPWTGTEEGLFPSPEKSCAILLLCDPILCTTSEVLNIPNWPHLPAITQEAISIWPHCESTFGENNWYWNSGRGKTWVSEILPPFWSRLVHVVLSWTLRRSAWVYLFCQVKFQIYLNYFLLTWLAKSSSIRKIKPQDVLPDLPSFFCLHGSSGVAIESSLKYPPCFLAEVWLSIYVTRLL